MTSEAFQLGDPWSTMGSSSHRSTRAATQSRATSRSRRRWHAGCASPRSPSRAPCPSSPSRTPSTSAFCSTTARNSSERNEPDPQRHRARRREEHAADSCLVRRAGALGSSERRLRGLAPRVAPRAPTTQGRVARGVRRSPEAARKWTCGRPSMTRPCPCPSTPPPPPTRTRSVRIEPRSRSSSEPSRCRSGSAARCWRSAMTSASTRSPAPARSRSCGRSCGPATYSTGSSGSTARPRRGTKSRGLWRRSEPRRQREGRRPGSAMTFACAARASSVRGSSSTESCFSSARSRAGTRHAWDGSPARAGDADERTARGQARSNLSPPGPQRVGVASLGSGHSPVRDDDIRSSCFASLDVLCAKHGPGVPYTGGLDQGLRFAAGAPPPDLAPRR
jgi:hypothetical protein